MNHYTLPTLHKDHPDVVLLQISSNDINKQDRIKTEKLTGDIINIGKSCIDLDKKEVVISSILPKNNIALTCLIQQVNDSLREQWILNGFNFISNDNISRTHLQKDEIHFEDLGTNILAGNFVDFLNRFILSKSIEHSWLYTDKHLKGLYGNIGVLTSDNSWSSEIVSDISNLGSASSNSCNVKDYNKNSSDPRLVLENLKFKNNHRLVIVNLNIHSISNKFDNLKLITLGKIDILVTTEPKTNSTFPLNQFAIQGYWKPYRSDRNRNGGGVFTNIQKDIPSKELKIHSTPEDIESIFLEIKLIKTGWLFCGCYHPPSQSDQYFLENTEKALDKYSKHYDKFMLVGDFNAEESEPCLSQFLYEYNAKNIVKESTCFKNVLNPSCIDLFITNSPLSF